MVTYTVTTYDTSALWIAAVELVSADKLTAAGTWTQDAKLVWYTIVAA